jgi:hypothetical protein
LYTSGTVAVPVLPLAESGMLAIVTLEVLAMNDAPTLYDAALTLVPTSILVLYVIVFWNVWVFDQLYCAAVFVPAAAAQYGDPVEPLEVRTCVAVPVLPLTERGVPEIVNCVVFAIKLEPRCKKIFENNRTRTVEIHDKNLYIFQSQLMFYWIDFEKNQLGRFNTKENEKLNQMWLAFYNNDKARNQIMFQFNLGDELYYFKMDANEDLKWIKAKINLSALNKSEVIQVYNNKQPILEQFFLLINIWRALRRINSR